MNKHDKRASDLIHRIVNEDLREYGQFVCDLYVGANTVGDPSLFVEICYAGGAIPVPAAVSVRLNSKLREALLRIGEERFPYLTYLVDQDAA